MTNTLWLMVGRGGSKGVPNKNLREIGGLSLVGWKARAAQEAMAAIHGGDGHRLVISTDSNAIAAEASRHGVHVPFIRPAALASDEAKSVDVIRHALAELGGAFDTVVLLEPSAPFATARHLREAFTLYCDRQAQLVVGMKHTEPHSSFIGECDPGGFVNNIVVKMMRYGDDTRRQARAPEWTMAGNLYIVDARVLTEERYQWNGEWSIYNGNPKFGYLTDRWHSIEIDSMLDLEMAEYAVAKGHVKVPQAITGWDKMVNWVTR